MKAVLSKKVTFSKVVIFASVLLFCYGLLNAFITKKLDMGKYYEILDNNEKDSSLSVVKIDADLKDLAHCKFVEIGKKSREQCFIDFYKKYTVEKGPAKAFLHLSSMMDKDPELVPGCHYIAHGIGEGDFVRNNGDLHQSYSFEVSKYFSNVGACGNGFYHGVAIALTRTVKSDDELYNTLLNFCDVKERWGGLGREACDHGIGHAVTIYYDHDREKSVAMCKRLHKNDSLDNEDGYFGCITGVMMEYGIFYNMVGLDTVDGVEGLKLLCQNYLPGTVERQACVVEGAGVVRRNNTYIQGAKDCQKMDDDVERKACTKLTLIHAVRIGRSYEAPYICSQLNSESAKVECTSFFALYLGSAVDIKYGKDYINTVDSVCRTLNFFEYIKCESLIMNMKKTFSSNHDFGFLPGFHDIYSYYKFQQRIKYLNSVKS